MDPSDEPWAEDSRRSYNGDNGTTPPMADGLERDTELLEIQNVVAWRHQLMAGTAGLFSAGPLGVAASLLAFRKVEGQWLNWALIGLLSAPPLAYGQWRLVRTMQQLQEGELAATGSTLAAAQLIREADRIAHACAQSQQQGSRGESIRNPLDGQDLFCDPTYPNTVVITSQSFEPLVQAASCGNSMLTVGTRAAQWLVSPAGSMVCQAVAQSKGWPWWQAAELNRRQLYRQCTGNLHLEALHGFTRTAHQLGRRDYCAEERALLARDQINQP